MLERWPEKEPVDLPKNPQTSRPSGLARGQLADLDFIVAPSFHSGPQKPGRSWILMAWSMAATCIDALIVVSLACLFLFVSLVLQRFEFAGVSIDRESLLRVSVPLFAFLYASYLVLVRIFMGSSLGEWACGLRLGIPRQRFSQRYALLVLARFFVVLGTGIVVLPLISILSGVDWAGRLSGVSLIRVSPASVPRSEK